MPYADCIPARQSERPWQAGRAMKLSWLATRARSESVLRWYLDAVADVTAAALVSFIGARCSQVKWYLFSYRRLTVLKARAWFAMPGTPRTPTSPVPVYSGYRSS